MRRSVVVPAAVAGVLALTSVAVAYSVPTATAQDPCVTVRDEVARLEAVYVAASEAGGLSSAERTQLVRDRAINAAALRRCPVPSPAPTSPTMTPSPTLQPSATATPTPPAAWPGPGNTGVPAGVILSPYTGPCTITTPNTVIDAMTVNCDLDIRVANVTISRSKVNGQITNFNGPGATLLVQDSEVDATVTRGHVVGNQYLTVRRANLHGGAASVSCAFYCDVQDSWLHGQYMPAGGDWHLDGVLSNGGNGGNDSHNLFRHNTIACDNPGSSLGGCSGNVGLFPDFAPLVGFTLDRNLLVSTNASSASSSSYCVYGGATLGKPYSGQDAQIVFTGNVFQRGNNSLCAHHGPVADFNPTRPGNVWSGNMWDDGTIVNP